MTPLVLGIDAGSRSGVTLLDPAQRPRLLLLRVVEADTADAWAERAFRVMEAVAALAHGRPMVGWIELTPPVGSNGWISFSKLCERRGQLRQAMTDAGLSIAGLTDVFPQTWTSILGVPRKKLGDGLHRLAEARRLVEMREEDLRGLGKAEVDAAESALVACARCWELLGLRAVKVKAPRKTRRAA